MAFGDGDIGATPTEVGERSGLTGETAIDRGTGDEERGVEPVGVVLPLVFFWNKVDSVMMLYYKSGMVKCDHIAPAKFLVHH